MNKTLRKSMIAAAIAMPALANAGGLYLYETGSTDLGFAGAGTAARAEDASTVYANPAGMTRLAGNQATVTAQLLYGDVDFKQDGTGVLTGSNPGNSVGWVPGGSAYYSHSISDQLKVGVAFYGTYGLAEKFGSQWVGRNLVDKTTLMAGTLQPTVAYRINDQWSVGAGLTANYGIFKMQRVAADATGRKFDTSDHDWQYGARLGVMFEPSKSTRIGLVWTSEIEYDFDVDLSIRGVLPGVTHVFPAKIKTYAPQQLMTSAYHQLNERWAVTGNLGWQEWSKFAASSVEAFGATTSSSLKLQDTWHAALGAQYQYNAKTKVSAGVAYDNSMYRHQNQANFVIPNGDTWRIGTGVQYVLSPQSDLGLGLEYARSDSSSMPRGGLLSGGYDHPYMVFMAASYSHRF
jgi:long-chain fatty acid transport protein